MPALEDSVFGSAGAFVSCAGAFVSGGVGDDDDEEVPELEEPELPQPAIPNATRTTPSAPHRRECGLACPSDDFVSMRPPFVGLVHQDLRRQHHPKPSGHPGG